MSNVNEKERKKKYLSIHLSYFPRIFLLGDGKRDAEKDTCCCEMGMYFPLYVGCTRVLSSPSLVGVLPGLVIESLNAIVSAAIDKTCTEICER